MPFPVRRHLTLLAPLALALTACTAGRDGGDPRPAHPTRQDTEAPAPACPHSGLDLGTGEAEAASGLRVLPVLATNCSSRPQRLEGHPGLVLLDEDRRPLDVDVLKGAEEITSGLDKPARPVTLRPGEQARTLLVWRNTYDDIREPPVSAAYLGLEPRPGAGPETLAVDGGIDLGSTGRLGRTAWQRYEAQPAG